MDLLGDNYDPSCNGEGDGDSLVVVFLPINGLNLVNGLSDLLGQSHLGQGNSHGFNVGRVVCQ